MWSLRWPAAGASRNKLVAFEILPAEDATVRLPSSFAVRVPCAAMIACPTHGEGDGMRAPPNLSFDRICCFRREGGSNGLVLL